MQKDYAYVLMVLCSFQSNVGDKVESLLFIRALITAIFTACITGKKQPVCLEELINQVHDCE